MSNHLVAVNSKACIGCNLCVLASSRILKGVFSISEGFISVFPKGKEGFDISIDRAQKTDYEEIVKICPRKCFEIATYVPEV